MIGYSLTRSLVVGIILSCALVGAYNPGTSWRARDYFVGITDDDKLVQWGRKGASPTTESSFEERVQSVAAGATYKAVYSTEDSFAAIRTDGTVAVWGKQSQDASAAPVSELTDIIDIYSSAYAFLALDKQGKATVWGGSGGGGILPTPTFLDAGVKKVWASTNGFTAKLFDGSTVHWSGYDVGKEDDQCFSGCTKCNPAECRSLSVNATMIDYQDITANDWAFAAVVVNENDQDIKEIATWGRVDWGAGEIGSANGPPQKTTYTGKIYATGKAFAAIMGDGSVVSWGEWNTGGFITLGVGTGDKPSILSSCAQISSTQDAFAALIEDGSTDGSTYKVVTWGSKIEGAEETDSDKLASNVEKVYASIGAFTALFADKTIYTWGSDYYGGGGTQEGSSPTFLDIKSGHYGFIGIKVNNDPSVWAATQYSTGFPNSTVPKIPDTGNWNAKRVIVTETGVTVLREISENRTEAYSWTTNSAATTSVPLDIPLKIVFGSTLYESLSTAGHVYPGLATPDAPEEPPPPPTMAPTLYITLHPTHAPAPEIDATISPTGSATISSVGEKEEDGSNIGVTIGIILGVPLAGALLYLAFTKVFAGDVDDDEKPKTLSRNKPTRPKADIENGVEMRGKSPAKKGPATPAGAGNVAFTSNPLRNATPVRR